MSSRSLNKVMLIGNLTRDPELRYLPQGAAVCSFGLATNRSWLPADSSERREEAEFHRIVAWNKLAELCSQLLAKGRKVYIEGRLQTRSWETPDGEKRQSTEIVAEDMVVLDSRRPESKDTEETGEKQTAQVEETVAQEGEEKAEEKTEEKTEEKVEPESKEEKKEEEKKETPKEKEDKINIDDIPF